MFFFAAETVNPLFGVFENNLINWIVLVILLGLLWSKTMPPIFKDRRNRIEETIKNAEQERANGQQFLIEQQRRIENAEKEADNILVEAKKVAEQMQTQIVQQTKKDIEDLQRKIEQQIVTQKQMAIAELRSQAGTAAVLLAEATLSGAITDSVRSGLQDQFIKQLDSMGSKS